jgi:hypothetical protein
MNGEDGNMGAEELAAYVELARKLAMEVGEPAFYLEKGPEVELSRRLLHREPLVQKALVAVGDEAESLGHGLFHVKKVAVDAGAIVISEGGDEKAVLLAHLAGALHDLRRGEPDHARRGAEEARKMLEGWGLPEEECEAVAFAIGNHEAFTVPHAAGKPLWELVSDALYDADKFRWGPDNFTVTVWRMISHYGVSLREAFPRLLKGMEGIERIRETFRTATGKRYGPDFIDRGLALGRRLFQVLGSSFGEQA